MRDSALSPDVISSSRDRDVNSDSEASSYHTSSLYLPGGTWLIWKLPSRAVTVKCGVAMATVPLPVNSKKLPFCISGGAYGDGTIFEITPTGKLTTLSHWYSQNELADIDREKGDLAAARPLFERSMEMTEKIPLGKRHPRIAELLSDYAALLGDEGKLIPVSAEVEEVIRQAVSEIRHVKAAAEWHEQQREGLGHRKVIESARR